MRKCLIALLLINVYLWSQELYVEDRVSQGGAFTALIYPIEDNTTVNLSLYNSQKEEVLALNSFDYYIYERGETVKLALGGVPVDLKPGRYKLVARGSSLRDFFFLEKYMEVEKVDFPGMEMAANSKMDSIVNGKITKERSAQSRRLWKAFDRFTPYGIYETEALSLPITGRYTSPFGFERVARYPSGSSHTSIHYGEDIAADSGSEVYAPGGGRVILVENRIVTGNSVLIEHLPGLISIYYHLDAATVTKGQMVKRGDVIGFVGTTGYSTGPHLHWEIRIATVAVNPLQFIGYPLIDKTYIMTIMNNK